MKLKFNILIIFIVVQIILVNNPLFGQYFKPLSKEEENQIETLRELAEGYEREKDYQNASNTINKIAFIYWQNSYLDDAIETFLKSVELNKRVGNLDYIKSLYSNIGVIYTDMEQLDNALDYFQLSLETRRKIGNKEEISSGMIDVAYILSVMNQPEDVIKVLNEALSIAEEINSSKLILSCYQLLSSNYESIGNVKKSGEYSSKYDSYEAFIREQDITDEYKEKEIENIAEIQKTKAEVQAEQLGRQLEQFKARAAQDSLNIQIKTKQDSLIQAEEEVKKRQLEIDLLDIERELQDLAIKEQQAKEEKQQVVIYAGIGILLLGFILIFVMFRSYKQQQAANKKLEVQNIEIGRQRDDIKNKSAEIEDALDLITLQAQNITKSINYAQGIQEALLPRIEDLSNYLEESFILFLPRDIVSGDYYWYREVDSKANIYKTLNVFDTMKMKDKDTSENGEDKNFIISAVDCTGHGVPGAFMSMIGYNILDEIVDRGITRADLILDELHKGVRRTLKQDVTENRDGMDMALCVYKKKDKILEYAGAKNPLLYIQDEEVYTIKGDKTPIGGLQTEHQRKFSRHEIKIDKPTSFYIFSDGFIDQFGGAEGRKFLIKNFRDLLLAIYKEPMEAQKEALLKAMEVWKGNKYKQIDDILVIGFKLR